MGVFHRSDYGGIGGGGGLGKSVVRVARVTNENCAGVESTFAS
jgi:hypothetical protein